MQDYEDQLFPYLPAIRKFSCGHLIPTSSLLVRTIASDEHGRLDFSYKFRNKHNAIRIGMALQQIAKHVQGGLIVFFPSYGYLEDVLRAWKEDTVMATLEQLRPVFSDGRTRQAEDVFRAYSETISNKGSAILLSVIGGKLSEGINFADDLGRCVVVVGLPYPNLQTPGWRAKVEYLDKKTTSHSSARGQAGREHAENVCMRSVNQAIGRVIRHKNDWASILLLDARYGDNRIQTKLPGWIRNATNAEDTKDLGIIVRELEVFFQGKATRNP
jgi:chromosome transmission fidelity protein 1